MPKKPRCQTCSTGWCKNHLLQLNPLTINLYHRKNFKIRLCPRLNKLNTKFQKIVPVFNSDKKYYTPSFYLEEEKKYYEENDERVLKNHKIKTEEDQNSGQTIWVPKHSRKRNYCFVCKTDYNDYLQHLEQPFHVKCLRDNQFTKFMHQIEQKFQLECKMSLLSKNLQENIKRQAPTEQSSSISESSPKKIEIPRNIESTIALSINLIEPIDHKVMEQQN